MIDKSFTHSSTALAAVKADEARRERDARLDIAEMIAEAHPAMPNDEVLALAAEAVLFSD